MRKLILLSIIISSLMAALANAGGALEPLLGVRMAKSVVLELVHTF